MFVLLFCLSVIVDSVSGDAHAAPSFNCKKAKSKIDRAVCASEELSALDKTLNDRYVSRVLKATKEEKERLRETQRDWLKRRNGECRRAENACLKKFYDERIAQLADMESAESTPEPVAGSVKNKSYKETIVPGKRYTFDVAFVVDSENDFWQPDTVKVILDNKPVQEIKIGDVNGASGDREQIHFVDYNFDGALDLEVLSSYGATGNMGFHVYLYDPKTRQFALHKELSEIVGSIGFDRKTKQLRVRNNGGAAGLIFTEHVYRWGKGNRLALLKKVSQEYDPSDKTESTFIKKEERMKDGKLELVKEETVKP